VTRVSLSAADVFHGGVAWRSKGETVLYTRCPYCGGIQALVCSGQFMPHMPTPVSSTSTGAYYCSYCGALPPINTCAYCFGRQVLVLAGASTTAPAIPGTSQQHAQVVHAKAGASNKALEKLFEVGGEIGKVAVRAYFGQQHG
jgi:hypothetical protein